MNTVKTMPIILKHASMASEFQKLTDRQRAVVLFVSQYLEKRFSVQGVWTEFYRSQAMQDMYYTTEIKAGKFIMDADGETKHYSKNKESITLSVHQLYRGSDLSVDVIDLKGTFRIREMTTDEIVELKERVNFVFPYGKGNYETCLFHQQFGKPHLHFQSLV